MSLIKVRRVLAVAGWQSWLVPLGAAMLAAGADYLHSRAEETAHLVDELDARVALRRAQLAGKMPLVDEPPAPEHVDEPKRPRWKLAVALVALATGVTALKAAPAVRGFLADVAESLDAADTFTEDGTLFDGVEGARPGPLVDEQLLTHEE